MAAHSSGPAPALPSNDSPSLPVTLSPHAAPFVPSHQHSQRDSIEDAKNLFYRCATRLWSLQTTSEQLKDELNRLFDQLLAENYNKTFEFDVRIKPEDVYSVLKHASSLVPLSQEHLVIKFCQLAHHLLNRLKLVMDEDTLNVLMDYITCALKGCSAWTHIDVLLALSAVVYGNGPHCHAHLSYLLGENGILLKYSSPHQPNMELRHVALSCMANLCFRSGGHQCLDDHNSNICFNEFLKTLQAPKPAETDEVFYCMLIQMALKGMQYCLSSGKWRYGRDEVLGSVLAALKKFTFQGAPGLIAEWPAVIYPTPLPQYEGSSAPKFAETPVASVSPERLGSASGNKKRKGKGKGKKSKPVENAQNGREEEETDRKEEKEEEQRTEEEKEAFLTDEFPSKTFCLSPNWKAYSSDSEFSDLEGSAQSKLRCNQTRVRQGALVAMAAFVKAVEKRTLYAYWYSFIPDSPSGKAPSLTLMTVILKDPSPKVRLSALQVLSAILDGSRFFLAAAEDMVSPRPSYTSFSFTLATAIRELHRSLNLALLAENSPQTLTQVIKSMSFLVNNSPYHRLQPGLLTLLWKTIRPFIRHRDATVRVSVLTFYKAVVTTQAPLPEVRLLLCQPDGSGGGGSLSPRGWRRRNDAASPVQTPPERSSPAVPCTPADGGESPLWLFQLCVTLITRPREEHSDSEGGAGGFILESAAVRLEALQVLVHLVSGYFSLIQTRVCEIAEVSTLCLSDPDRSIQLHGTKLLAEFGLAVNQQYKKESRVPESSRIPVAQAVQFWCSVLSGPLNAALQNGQHPALQASACQTLASIMPRAFVLLPEKLQLMCITVLLGLTYVDDCLVKMAAVRAVGVYVLFPGLREDVMFVMDAANIILPALNDRSANVRAKASWSLGNLTDTLITNMEALGVGFREEIPDALVLKMLQTGTRSSSDKDRVRCNSVRALGNILRFLQKCQIIRPPFHKPLEEAIRTLVKTILSDATMKVRWNACYALGNAFRNPALPLASASWSDDAFGALCDVVASCQNFKVRIKSAAALAMPASRVCYGDAERFRRIWNSLAAALKSSNDTTDYLEFQYSSNLRLALSQALLHLLSLCQPQDMATICASLVGSSRRSFKEHFIWALSENQGREAEETDGARDSNENSPQRVATLKKTLERLQSLPKGEAPEEKPKEGVVIFLQELLSICEEF